MLVIQSSLFCNIATILTICNLIKELEIEKFIINALAEDIGDGDYTSLASIPKNATSKAHLLVKDNGIIAGIELAKMIFNEVMRNFF